MHIGFIGLGRMGSNMTKRLLEKGFTVSVFDVNKGAVDVAVSQGAIGSNSIEHLVNTLPQARFVWVMVQRSTVASVLDELIPHLRAEDIVVDGGNTYYKETLERLKILSEKGIHFIDVGVSGGVAAARNGACLMVGGEKHIVDGYRVIFEALAQENGFGHVGTNGAGHFVKMVHNGIEYGMMQAIAEGAEALHDRTDEFLLDLEGILDVYSHGSIVESSLLSWLVEQVRMDPKLSLIQGAVPHGDTEDEMRLLAHESYMPALSTAINERVKSRENERFAAKAVASMRNAFGGHAVKKHES